MSEPAAVILRAEPEGRPLLLDADELALLSTGRCGRCCHLIGLHPLTWDDYGDTYHRCAVDDCGCELTAIGPETKPSPFTQPPSSLLFFAYASRGA